MSNTKYKCTSMFGTHNHILIPILCFRNTYLLACDGDSAMLWYSTQNNIRGVKSGKIRHVAWVRIIKRINFDWQREGKEQSWSLRSKTLKLLLQKCGVKMWTDFHCLTYLWTHWSTFEIHNKSGISWPSKRLAVSYACTLIGCSTICIPLHTHQHCFTQHNEQIMLPEFELPVCISSSHHFFLLGYFPN